MNHLLNYIARTQHYHLSKCTVNQWVSKNPRFTPYHSVHKIWLVVHLLEICSTAGEQGRDKCIYRERERESWHHIWPSRSPTGLSNSIQTQINSELLLSVKNDVCFCKDKLPFTDVDDLKYFMHIEGPSKKTMQNLQTVLL